VLIFLKQEVLVVDNLSLIALPPCDG